MTIKWNPNLKLAVSDVDETIADVYTDATPEMITCLENLLRKDIVLFLISGGGLKSIQDRVTNKIAPELRAKILIAHCSGAEVYGFDKDGKIKTPYYSLYSKVLNQQQKDEWREIVSKVVEEFKLKTFPTMTVDKFLKEVGDDPLSVMLADRGPQITFEFVNSYKSENDFRTKVQHRFQELFEMQKLPIEPRLAGVFALDLVLQGVSKTTAIEYIMNSKEILIGLGLDPDISKNYSQIEIWGDKFSEVQKGSDRLMSYSFPEQVRSISFRQENKDEFKNGYNIQLWDGKKHLHEGLLEYLQISGL